MNVVLITRVASESDITLCLLLNLKVNKNLRFIVDQIERFIISSQAFSLVLVVILQ